MLYLGAGLGLTLVRWVSPRAREAALRGSDGRWLAAIVLVGGVLGPLLMLTGLHRISGVTGSLLVNLEMPFTMLLAVLVFREHLGGGELAGSLLIAAAAVLLGVGSTDGATDAVGAVAVAGAARAQAPRAGPRAATGSSPRSPASTSCKSAGWKPAATWAS